MLRSPGRPRSGSESCGIREAGHRCARRTVPRGWSAAAGVLGSGTRGPRRGVAFGHHDDSASAIGRVRFGRRTCRLDRRRSVFVRGLDSARRACPTFVDRSIRSFAGASVEHARTGRLSMVECLRRGGRSRRSTRRSRTGRAEIVACPNPFRHGRGCRPAFVPASIGSDGAGARWPRHRSSPRESPTRPPRGDRVGSGSKFETGLSAAQRRRRRFRPSNPQAARPIAPGRGTAVAPPVEIVIEAMSAPVE